MPPARLLLISPLIAASIALAAPLSAQTSTDPEMLKTASEEFDAGRRAYKLKDFSAAAIHFENAFRDAPRPEPLRMAIRSRKEAGDLARAATLCVRARTLYPGDAETQKTVDKVLGEAAPRLHRVMVSCEPACSIALDGRLVLDDRVAGQELFTSPGAHSIVVGWGPNRSESRSVEATEGTASELRFTEPKPSEPPPPKPVVTTTPPPPAGSKKLSPIVFWAGVGVTAALGGVTIWSGLDTRVNPGPDTVRRKCVGLGADCPEYQDGLASERRTNYLLAGTAGAAVLTGVIGWFFTDWGRTKGRAPSQGAAVVPWAGARGGGVVGSAQF